MLPLRCFTEKQQALELPKQRLTIDVKTRRNSIYFMVERFLEYRPAIIAALIDARVHSHVTIMHHLYITTLAISSESTPIVSYCHSYLSCKGFSPLVKLTVHCFTEEGYAYKLGHQVHRATCLYLPAGSCHLGPSSETMGLHHRWCLDSIVSKLSKHFKSKEHQPPTVDVEPGTQAESSYDSPPEISDGRCAGWWWRWGSVCCRIKACPHGNGSQIDKITSTRSYILKDQSKATGGNNWLQDYVVNAHRELVITNYNQSKMYFGFAVDVCSSHKGTTNWRRHWTGNVEKYDFFENYWYIISFVNDNSHWTLVIINL